MVGPESDCVTSLRPFFLAFLGSFSLALAACGLDERNLTVEDAAPSGDGAAPAVDASPDAGARSDTGVSSEAGTRDVAVEAMGAPDQTLGMSDQAVGADQRGPDQASAGDATTESAPARDAAADAARDAPMTTDGGLAASLTLTAAAGSAANFGNVTVGSSRDETFVLSNAGQQQATSIGISVTGAGFARLVGVANECGTTLAGGGNCNIGVRFTATTLGAQMGALMVSATTGAPAPVNLGATSVCATGQTACGGTCVDTTSDPDNCGRCNHGCLTGGLCSGSVCQPITFVAATQTSNVVDIATDGNVVVWADSGNNTVNQVGSPGATKIVLGSSPTVNAPLNVGVDAASGTIFWAQLDGVIGSATRGLANSASATGCMGATPIAAINVFSSNSVDVLSSGVTGFLATCSITLGMPGSGVSLADTTIPSNALGRTITPSRFVGDVQHGAILQLGVSGDFNPSILATIPNQTMPLYVVQDSTFVYWSAATGGGPAILRTTVLMSAAMAPQTILTNAGGQVGGMTTDGVNVYYQNGNGIFYIPIAGASAGTRLTTQNGLFLRYASGAVYFASGGAIFKIATP